MTEPEVEPTGLRSRVEPPEPGEPTKPREPIEPADAANSGPPARADDAPRAPRRARPWLERIGMAAIAAVMAALFGGVAAAAWIGQEPFLAVMAGIGCLMTAWVGGMTLFRG